MRIRNTNGTFAIEDPIKRFWTKVHKLGGDGYIWTYLTDSTKVLIQLPNNNCWIWTAQYRKRRPYYLIYDKPRRRKVISYRYSWEVSHGPIPVQWHIDHLCLNIACVNPDHLEPVTPKENLRRQALHTFRKTHCKNGHLLVEDNIIYKIVNNTRIDHSCRQCTNELKRQSYYRNQALIRSRNNARYIKKTKQVKVKDPITGKYTSIVCPKGHDKQGYKVCRVCKREQDRQYRAKKHNP